MIKRALSLILAALSAGFYAQGAEENKTGVAGTTNVVAGGTAARAREALGAGALISTNAVLKTAGVLAAVAVAAGSKAESTTTLR